MALALRITILLIGGLVLAHDARYINIDCGGAIGFTDSRGQAWVRDAGFTSTGAVARVSIANSSQELGSLRYFPDGYDEKSCYEVPVVLGNKYLVRATFFYGDYDGKRKPPSFDLYLQASHWTALTTSLDKATSSEILAVATSNSLSVCLAASAAGNVPFISSLELRHLEATMYEALSLDRALLLFQRLDIGSLSPTSIRLPDDTYDRIWTSDFGDEDYPRLVTQNPVALGSSPEQAPLAVMQTARTKPVNSSSDFSYFLPFPEISSGRKYCIILYFAEVTSMNSGDLREFDIILSGTSLNNTPVFQSVNVANQAGGAYIALELHDYNRTFYGPVRVKLIPTQRSTLLPFLSALEVYTVLDGLSVGTFASDAAALSNVKETFNLEGAGDPCLPSRYKWDWINCDNGSPPRINALTLSNMKLQGTIPNGLSRLTELNIIRLDGNHLTGGLPDLSALKNLTLLDLHSNSLSGLIPASITSLPNLQMLYLQDNNFSGPKPSVANTNMFMNTSGNPCLLEDSPCFNAATTGVSRHKHRLRSLWISLAVGLPVLSAITVLICFLRRFIAAEKRFDPVETPRHPCSIFRLDELILATQNFSKELGRGGFAKVYYGVLSDGREIAAKVYFEENERLRKRRDAFLNEVEILSRVHHKNLVSLIGYCVESLSLIVVFEYMSGGTVQGKLHAGTQACLTWETRLTIALDAAQGVEYLHTCCIPQVMHRDLKSSNILLSDKMMAKVGDFGISKFLSPDDDISNSVKGTPGYVDPEYFATNRFSEKSDVYSFGVVLLELICGRGPLDSELLDQGLTLIVWFRSLVQSGKTREVVDLRLENTYNLESMQRVVDTANSCIESDPSNRPDMSIIVGELKEALWLQRQQLSPTDKMIVPLLLLHRSMRQERCSRIEMVSASSY
ncbi:probable LRR receptor-like serine/threonine-protein kinase At1g67720 isoform X1 [Selaginella moellendorffii]|uniref:probable LRR receptor-like serine/threonine-protein kinase At1g67720 isoform X1 n=1 Tax=Selaginella moellendorffii TaxID=88036 RepID=UPI000D1CED69|nr:probable LRR receptor-like serine/threonine-protein kinase At1g67720 isoform X1 [Selaginella moellendorffii]|eukprot:XP_024540395.1 probable LRR receptor-like serine/threonine-protein kinase At1g67720 isoform X1 [Selaginella moellendorffii]